MENGIKMVIGSYGSYAAANDRALGSKWIDLADFSDWSDVLDELTAEGFDLAGEDAELFVQDVEGLPSDIADGNPETIFNILKNAGMLEPGADSRLFETFIGLYGWDDFAELVDQKSDSWADDVTFYDGQSLEDVAEELFFECYDVPDDLRPYIDINAFARDLSFGGYNEGLYGVIYRG